MNKIIDDKRENIFGALKLIEQLYLEDLIPGYIFRNIIKDYGGNLSDVDFKCQNNDAPPKK